MSKRITNIQEFLDYISQQAQAASADEQNKEQGFPFPSFEEPVEEDHEHFIGINIEADNSISLEEVCGYTPIQEVKDYVFIISEEQGRDLFLKLAKILV